MTTLDLPKFLYPWEGLERLLPSIGFRSLRLLSYGSLINRESASITLQSHSVSSAKPAVGRGIKRLFNYRMPQVGWKRYGRPLSARHVAVLNVLSTADPTDCVNGMLQSVQFTDIERLRKREVGYALIPIRAKTWDSELADSELVYTLESTDTEEDILPHIRYLEVCEAGARAVSQEFLDYFCRTTFLADGTPLSAWRERHND